MKFRILNILALICNIVVGGFGGYTLYSLIYGNLQSFDLEVMLDVIKYLPNFGLIFGALFSLLSIPCNIAAICTGKNKLPKFFNSQKLMAISIILTGLALNVLSVMGGDYSFNDLFLTGDNLYLNTILPATMVVNFLLFENPTGLGFGSTFGGLGITLAYCIAVVVYSSFVTKSEDFIPYEFLRFNSHGFSILPYVGIVIAAAFAFAFVIWILSWIFHGIYGRSKDDD